MAKGGSEVGQLIFLTKCFQLKMAVEARHKKGSYRRGNEETIHVICS